MVAPDSLPLTLLVLLTASPLGAQASADAQEGSSAPLPPAVQEIRIEPDPIVVQMGDTVEARGAAIDSAGNPVSDAPWGATNGSTFEIEAVAATDSGQVFRVWGVDVGRSSMGLFLARLREGQPPEWRHVGEVDVEVLDYPVSRIELGPLEAAPYAGTKLSPSVRVLNTLGGKHASARAALTTSDSSVATIDSEGRLHLLRPGRVRVVASADTVHTAMDVEVVPNPVRAVALPDPPSRLRTGDAIPLDPVATNADGDPVSDVAWTYRVSGSAHPGDATVYSDGVFVAARPGRYRVEADAGAAAASVELAVFARDVGQGTTFVAHVPTPRATDLWVFEGRDGRDYAYMGTLSAATMYAVDVTDPGEPFVTDSVKADGRRVNDVKINGERTIAIITSESAANRRNGITLLDIEQPAHPRVITHYTEGLTGGVHNVWFVGDLVYAVNDGTRDLHIIDITDPTAPVEVGRWGLERPGRYLHDVSVVDGLAYLSYWNDGVVILDVGAGIEGGTPTEPAFVSSFEYRYEINGESYGNTHHAVRYEDYLFLGDEIFGCPGCDGPRGYVHVVDVSDIRKPQEVAYYRVPDAGSHNLWIEDDRLYVAYYQGGVRVVDVSGELRGDLLAQGREIAVFETSRRTLDRGTGATAASDEVPAPGSDEVRRPDRSEDPASDRAEAPAADPSEPPAASFHPASGFFGAGRPTDARAWGPQPYKGYLFVSDMNSGLWVVRLEPPEVTP